MRAIFVVPSPHENFLPLMEEIQYIDIQGVIRGGYFCIGPAPQMQSVIICIDSNDEKLNTIVENYPELLYLMDV